MSATQACLTAYGEKPGLLVIGADLFWGMVRQRTLTAKTLAGVIASMRWIHGIPTLVTNRQAELLLAIPESKAEEVRKHLMASEPYTEGP